MSYLLSGHFPTNPVQPAANIIPAYVLPEFLRPILMGFGLVEVFGQPGWITRLFIPTFYDRRRVVTFRP